MSCKKPVTYPRLSGKQIDGNKVQTCIGKIIFVECPCRFELENSHIHTRGSICISERSSETAAQHLGPTHKWYGKRNITKRTRKTWFENSFLHNGQLI